MSNVLGDAQGRCFVKALKAKEEVVTFYTLFKSYVVVDPTKSVEKLEERYKQALIRTRTTRCEMVIVKAIASTTKTAQQKSDAIKDAFADHSKATREVAEEWFFGPLFAEANRVMTAGATEASSTKPTATSARSGSKPAKSAAKAPKAKK